MDEVATIQAHALASVPNISLPLHTYFEIQHAAHEKWHWHVPKTSQVSTIAGTQARHLVAAPYIFPYLANFRLIGEVGTT